MVTIDSILDDNTKRILDILSVGIIVTDGLGVVRYVNPEYMSYSGLSLDDIVGKQLANVRPGAVLPSVLQSKKALYNIPRKIGNVESYNDYFPIIIEDKFIGGIVIVKDIVRMKEILEMIKENNEKISQLGQVLKSAFKARFEFADIIGINGGLNKVADICYKAARADSPVLLMGESGTGKEVFAQSIHNESKRKDYPFVDVNCATLPEHLLESELFGYAPGAFTGANQKGKMGLFEIANGGTIFLDEISGMSITLQTKLLRVLQEKCIRRIGGEKNIDIDVKVIAATNRNVNELISDSKFREDLYFRLAVFVVNLPPLRERKSDLALLVDHFIKEQMKEKKHVIKVSDKVMDIFNQYDWCGNVRELKNTIEYAVNLTEDFIVKAQDLPKNLIEKNNIGKFMGNTKEKSLKEIVEGVEAKVLKEYLDIYGHSLESKKKIAIQLDISTATLYNKLKKYNL
ncbi:sigma 54-interacting transcriptional regulator [Wukongibacter baidiensis]|uniref:sigma-54 interaction domain-containing protein n=1 Tax=Wukongibacter baidiensis TaxID=1723361 RepID=UPI003D7F4692